MTKLGDKHSEGTRRKIREALTGRPKSEEHKRAIVEGMRRARAEGLRVGCPPKVEATPNAIHKWLRYNYPPTGVCELCGSDAGLGHRGTQLAYLFHPEPYTRDRSDYLEVCEPCHGDEHAMRRAGMILSRP